MKKCLLLVSALIMFCYGCIKEEKGCTNATVASEEPQITAYAASKGITATKHSSGLYYQVINGGTDVTPTTTSLVTVNYVGKYLDGRVFDSSTAPVSFRLNNVIEGWGIGLPLIKKGGKIKMIVPSSLAYGCQGRSPIPSNTVLYFDIDLINVQ